MYVTARGAVEAGRGSLVLGLLAQPRACLSSWGRGCVKSRSPALRYAQAVLAQVVGGLAPEFIADAGSRVRTPVTRGCFFFALAVGEPPEHREDAVELGIDRLARRPAQVAPGFGDLEGAACF